MKNGEQVFLQILLEDVQVASVNLRLPKLTGSDGALALGEPSEYVVFSFNRVTWIYILLNGGTIRWDTRSGREM